MIEDHNAKSVEEKAKNCSSKVKDASLLNVPVKEGIFLPVSTDKAAE